MLRIHVVEAKHLMKKDIGVLGKGKSDPYAIVTVGAQEFRTQTIDNTVDPKWDYWCEVSGLINFYCYTCLFFPLLCQNFNSSFLTAVFFTIEFSLTIVSRLDLVIVVY